MKHLKTFENFEPKNEDFFGGLKDMFRPSKPGYSGTTGGAKGANPGNFTIIVNDDNMSRIDSNKIETYLKKNPNVSYYVTDKGDCVIDYNNQSIDIKNQELFGKLKESCSKGIRIYFISLDKELNRPQINDIGSDKITLNNESGISGSSNIIKVLTITKLEDLPNHKRPQLHYSFNKIANCVDRYGNSC